MFSNSEGKKTLKQLFEKSLLFPIKLPKHCPNEARAKFFSENIA